MIFKIRLSSFGWQIRPYGRSFTQSKAILELMVSKEAMSLVGSMAS